MPKSKNYNNWLKQNYPRKCEKCDYISNNPAMYSYHKKTHNLIPQGKLCDHGCGQLASTINTHGKYTCLPIAQHCPEYIKKHSKMVKKQWDGDIIRKQKTKEIFLRDCAKNPVAIEKNKNARRKKTGLITPEIAKEYRHYARKIRVAAQIWAKEQGYELGQQTYHVDHKLSILDAWKANLPIAIVNHPANLQILEANKNSSKGSKSIITVEELLKLTKSFN
jgi:5-methylcytosine-specific restriction endonuclease McrA